MNRPTFTLRRGIVAALIMAMSLLGIGTAAVTVAPAPAQAATSITICLPLYNQSGQIYDWTCIDIPLAVKDCFICDVAIGWDEIVLPAEHGILHAQELAHGMSLLARGDDARAQSAFLASARALGRTTVGVGVVGIPSRNRIEPMPLAWLESAATHLSRGLALMQEALVRPDPDPYLRAAMAEFGTALEKIAWQTR